MSSPNKPQKRLKRLGSVAATGFLRKSAVREDWVSLVEQKDNASVADYKTLRRNDLNRRHLMSLTRGMSPIETVGKFRMLPRTVLARLIKSWVTWLILFIYGGAAAGTRSGVNFGELDLTAFDGGGTIVTFMVIFYIGYCYNRYTVSCR